jgi:hypothetical protein
VGSVLCRIEFSVALDNGKLNRLFRITKYDLRSGRLANESSG